MNRKRWLAVLCCCSLAQACVTSGDSRQRPASDKEAAVANMNLGVGYLRQGRADLAVEALERALDLDPRSADVHSTVALAYDQLGNLEQAETHYRRATTLDTGNAAAANRYAVFLCRQNRWRDAEPHFRRAANTPRYTTPAVALTNAGVCARDAGDEAKAEEYFRAALVRDPVFPDALMSMAELSYRNQNYLQARAFLQRYRDARPANAPMLWLCVNVERELGNRSAADRCAMQLREGFPDSPELARLEELLRSDGR